MKECTIQPVAQHTFHKKSTKLNSEVEREH